MTGEQHSFTASEYIATEPSIVEVCNTSSHYFGETFLVTHKAYALDKAWFKCVKAGAAPSGLSLWFGIMELEFT